MHLLGPMWRPRSRTVGQLARAESAVSVEGKEPAEGRSEQAAGGARGAKPANAAGLAAARSVEMGD